MILFCLRIIRIQNTLRLGLDKSYENRYFASHDLETRPAMNKVGTGTAAAIASQPDSYGHEIEKVFFAESASNARYASKGVIL
jgi:hypothetical protein